ncbi:MAG TPA: 6,7-dimethyl-8-ribityllumazine synthase [Prolixibacteraceae bacterium]|nr:6,7-dimethyl-8-ribityllumazine synthase [Prolixibacteraceae bacterium]
MATRNLSDYDINKVPSAENMKFGIVVAEWNYHITQAMTRGAIQTLLKHGCKEENITVKHVPGSFELTLGGQYFAEYTDVDGVLLIGSVIKGETPHFDYICQGVTQGATQLNMKYNIPFAFAVLTTLNEKQALERSGGSLGNKGDEAAITVIKMIALQRELQEGV